MPEGQDEWQGRPVARRVADAEARRRATLTGVLREVVAHRRQLRQGPLDPTVHAGALDATFDDGSGTIVLRWLGRESIAGIAAGARLEVEGTVTSESDRLVILNPLYRFEGSEPTAGDCAGGRPPDGETARDQPVAEEGGDRPIQMESSTSW